MLEWIRRTWLEFIQARNTIQGLEKSLRLTAAQSEKWHDRWYDAIQDTSAHKHRSRDLIQAIQLADGLISAGMTDRAQEQLRVALKGNQ